jgi:hypothetical protein
LFAAISFLGPVVLLFGLVSMEDALICLAESGAQRGAEMPKFNLIKNAESSF